MVLVVGGDDRCDNYARMRMHVVVCRLYVQSNTTTPTSIYIVCTIRYNCPKFAKLKIWIIDTSIDQQVDQLLVQQ
jgi:hypothetical protein